MYSARGEYSGKKAARRSGENASVGEEREIARRWLPESLPGLVAVQTEGRVFLRVALLAVVAAQLRRAVLGRKHKVWKHETHIRSTYMADAHHCSAATELLPRT